MQLVESGDRPKTSLSGKLVSKNDRKWKAQPLGARFSATSLPSRGQPLCRGRMARPHRAIPVGPLSCLTPREAHQLREWNPDHDRPQRRP